MLRNLSILFLTLIAGAALAGTVKLTWQPVTTRTDASAVTIGKYNVYRAPTAAGLATATALGSSATAAFTDAASVAGTQFYSITAVDSDGVESDKSTPVSAVTPNAKPSTPTGVTVGPTLAYDIVKQPGHLALLAVGNVPNGVACDMTQSVNGLYAVPTSSVTWLGTVRPPVVFASCG